MTVLTWGLTPLLRHTHMHTQTPNTASVFISDTQKSFQSGADPVIQQRVGLQLNTFRLVCSITKRTCNDDQIHDNKINEKLLNSLMILTKHFSFVIAFSRRNNAKCLDLNCNILVREKNTDKIQLGRALLYLKSPFSLENMITFCPCFNFIFGSVNC